jgi:flavodoxin
MKIAVKYFSRSGNTKKLAETIAQAVGLTATPISAPVAKPVDLLILGGSVYGFGVDNALKTFIGELTPELVKKVAVFSTSAVVSSAYPYIKKLVEAKGISMASQEYHCRGSFGPLHKNRPNEEDLKAAAAFAKNVAKRG